MTRPDSGAAVFTGLVDLASAAIGGRALSTNDEFFAECQNLVEPTEPVFLPDEYTEHGKWMDGWESRRKRGPGHDWCVLRLGASGVIRGVDIDTAHFLGNHPPFASLDATRADGDALESATWTEVLPQSPLRAGSQNLFAVLDPRAYTHVRLNIFPDGGVARLRVYGDVEPAWRAVDDELARRHVARGDVDLAALHNGGLALACSDMFFGSMNHLIAPGRAANMGEGWETRRRRGPGHDWIVVRLGGRGSVHVVELDTNHFKGNFPDRCRLEGIDAAGARTTDLIAHDGWRTILDEMKMQADERRFLRDEIVERGPFTHVRLSVYPDGGVSRMRVFGQRAES
ncbi:MAG: allantoicase [Planctomycetes bacterium]|nr:allantoicase [Planctomycetota bacterium]